MDEGRVVGEEGDQLRLTGAVSGGGEGGEEVMEDLERLAREVRVCALIGVGEGEELVDGGLSEGEVGMGESQVVEGRDGRTTVLMEGGGREPREEEVELALLGRGSGARGGGRESGEEGEEEESLVGMKRERNMLGEGAGYTGETIETLRGRYNQQIIGRDFQHPQDAHRTAAMDIIQTDLYSGECRGW